MIKAGQTAIGLVFSAWGLCLPTFAWAQSTPSSATSTPAGAMMANPYLNPYLNPYMNPMATQQPMNSSNALMYLYAAQAAKGGIGSGRLSNPGATQVSKPAELPTSASRPGGGAARYFNPGPVNVNGAGRYYSQRGRYFNHNGH